ncbi:MAG: class II SORL domain-containing protein [Bacteroidetes bacterium]|nr:class II SORL domain-containing protein [Bacteroidota bacterium]
MKRKNTLLGIFALMALLLISSGVFANKTSVTIVAPEKVKKGTEVTVKIEVKHIGNTKGHYTDWVSLKVNGEEVKRWEYSKDNLPDDQNFTLEYKIIANANLEIVAEGNCNKHGSKGEDKFTVSVE